MEPPREVIDYYETFAEESRLASGPSRLEFERTKDLLARLLPVPPARIVDVGGAAGTYSAWLAELGYDVHLVDASARLVAEARKINPTLKRAIASLSVADARSLPQPDSFADVVMIMGPLYHLTVAADREAALREAHRVLRQPGLLVVAGISRYASALDGLARKLTSDPAFVKMRDQDLEDGQHRNATDRIDYFTTAYFHRPEDLRSEIEAAGFDDVRVVGVEGPAWILADLDDRWADPSERAEIMTVARALESEPAILGVSAHLLGVGRRTGSTPEIDRRGRARETPFRIDTMTAEDWPGVRRIYEQGLETGVGSFETAAPSWEQWDAARLPHSRLVARRGSVIGWAALSPVSKRACYGGVAEVGIYVAEAERGQGIGRALLEALVESSEAQGIWMLQGATIAGNTMSLALQERCGFRVVGRRERIAKRDGRWHDTVLTERRSRNVGNV